MKKIVLIFVTCFFVANNAIAAKYEIDSAHTYPNFTISHLGFSTTHGRFGKTTGTIMMDQKKGEGSVEVTIDAASIDTGFAKRDKHLRSPDFLNVAEFPKITFKSTSVKFSGKGATIKGNLTIMGKSKLITLIVKKIKCGVHPFNKKNVCGFDAATTIKRSDFGVKYGLPAIGDDMAISLQVEAVKK